MSKRKEIQIKEQLQLQLQSQFNKLDQTVLSWLKPATVSDSESSKDTSEKTADVNGIQQTFQNQFIIPSGKGINFGNTEDSDKLTIEEFLNLTDKKKDSNNDRISKVKNSKINLSSNSLRSLTNKLRNDRRKEIKEPQRREYIKPINKVKTETKENSDSEDEENEKQALSIKSKAKNNKVKSKRPF